MKSVLFSQSKIGQETLKEVRNIEKETLKQGCNIEKEVIKDKTGFKS